MALSAARRNNLKRLLKPRHIAVIGGRDAQTVIGECDRIGFAGQVWPVNPKRQEIGGRQCFASVGDLPEAPDAAFVAVRRDQAIDVTGQLARMGAGGVVVYAAGFAETGPAGATAQDELVRAAGDMALVGPNCYGIVNYLDRAALWPFARGGDCPGYGAAIITQSGMLSSDLAMSQRSMPFAYLVSLGNQAGIQMEDFISVLCAEEPVRAIGLHIEGLRDIAAFEAAALEALRRGVPIVALKTGTSRIGQALTQSHTASLSGANELYDALFKRLGIISVSSPAQMIETLKLICVAGVPAGLRVAAFTCSGGGATMLADHAETVGIAFPDPSPDAGDRLTELLPETAAVSNPLDYTTPIWGDAERLPEVMGTLLDDGADAALLVQDYPLPELDDDKQAYVNDARSFCAAVRRAGVPAAVCSTLPENLDGATRDMLVVQGVAPLQGIHEALNALSGAAWHGQRRADILADPPSPLLPPVEGQGGCLIDEWQGKRMLADAGLAVPDGRACSGEDAASAAGDLGFPVALKMLSAQLPHKTEMGAIALRLESAEAVRQAVARIRDSVALRAPQAVSERFLVERMAEAPVAELLVSVRGDEQFGLAMTLASGGVLAELIGDAETVLLPASRREIAAAVGRLKVARLFEGHRGGASADQDALVDALERLAGYAAERADEVSEIEINPLFVGQHGVCAVDALVTMRARPVAVARHG